MQLSIANNYSYMQTLLSRDCKTVWILTNVYSWPCVSVLSVGYVFSEDLYIAT